jgi:hypothetical protein
MPYLNGKYLTDDEVTEREMATRAQYQDFSEREMDARAQYQDREAAPIRSMYQPEGSQRPDIPGDWRPERAPGPYGRPWGSPNYGEPLTQAQMDREAAERAMRARDRAAGHGDPAFEYERPLQESSPRPDAKYPVPVDTGPGGQEDPRDLPDMGPGRMEPVDRLPDQGPIGLPPWMRARAGQRLSAQGDRPRARGYDPYRLGALLRSTPTSPTPPWRGPRLSLRRRA